MPLYEYECEKCGHRFELIQKFSDALASSCPSCSGKVRKLVSSPAIQFKGTGWYITDYARKPSGGQAASETGKTDATKDAGGGSDKSDKKKDSSEKKTSGSDSTSTSSSKSSPPSSSSS